MARTKKVKFDTSSIFIEGKHTETEKRAFIASPLFPIFASAYNTTGGRIRVGQMEFDDNQVVNVNIVSSVGFYVGDLTGRQSNSVGEFAYRTTNNSLVSPKLSCQLGIRTCNPRYLASKLSAKSNHPAVEALRGATDSAESVIDNLIYTLVDGMVDKEYGGSVHRSPTVILDSNIATFLSNIALGTASIADMPVGMRKEFDAAYAEYNDQRTKFAKSIATTKDFISGGKWLMFNDINEGIIVCATESDKVEEALDAYVNGGHLPGFRDNKITKYTQYSVPPKWYPNYEAIPEDYRRELDYALMVLKIHRNSDQLIPKRDGSGGGAQFWPDVGAAVYAQYIGSTVVMLQR